VAAIVTRPGTPDCMPSKVRNTYGAGALTSRKHKGFNEDGVGMPRSMVAYPAIISFVAVNSTSG